MSYRFRSSSGNPRRSTKGDAPKAEQPEPPEEAVCASAARLCSISKADSLYEVGRAYDVFTLAGQMAIHDDGEIFSCDLTPHGKQRKIFTTREPLNAISAITPFNHPLNMVSHKIAPAIATNNCVVVKPTELTPMTARLKGIQRVPSTDAKLVTRSVCDDVSGVPTGIGVRVSGSIRPAA